MYTLKLNDSWDLDFVNGVLQLIDGAELVAQRLRMRLLTHQGEWFLDTSLGVDYRGQVMVKAPDLQVVRALLLDVIATTDGVLSVTQLDLDYSSSARTLAVTFEVVTDEGAILTAQGAGLDLFDALATLVFTSSSGLYHTHIAGA